MTRDEFKETVSFFLANFPRLELQEVFVNGQKKTPTLEVWFSCLHNFDVVDFKYAIKKIIETKATFSTNDNFVALSRGYIFESKKRRQLIMERNTEQRKFPIPIEEQQENIKKIKQLLSKTF